MIRILVSSTTAYTMYIAWLLIGVENMENWPRVRWCRTSHLLQLRAARAATTGARRAFDVVAVEGLISGYQVIAFMWKSSHCALGRIKMYWIFSWWNDHGERTNFKEDDMWDATAWNEMCWHSPERFKQKVRPDEPTSDIVRWLEMLWSDLSWTKTR